MGVLPKADMNVDDRKMSIGNAQRLTLEEISLRKRWLEFDPEDEAIVAGLDAILMDNLDQIIADMYAHFFAFEETKAYFPDDATFQRASKAQRNYFSRLTKGNYGQEYVNDRLRVGSTHYQVDLDPKWYIGAYNRVLSSIIPVLLEEFESKPASLAKAISAMMKLIFFDMGLAIETYISAKEAAIRRHRSAISELETERRVTKSILESAPIGIVELDGNLNCLECNAEFLKIIEATQAEDVIGKRLCDVAPYLLQEPFAQVLKSGQAYKATTDLLHFSPASLKSQTYWDWAAWPMKNGNGKTVGLFAQFTNATDRVLLQQQREDFVATLTHDLKTPILAANRAVKLLVEGDFGSVSESQARILETIHQSNEALYKLVQTLLDVYRYDSGAKKLTLSPHDLASIINQVVNELQSLATTKDISLRAIVPTKSQEVVCDAEEMRRVIQNLLDNSLKFTPSDGLITIRMNQKGDCTIVEVADTGKGIREEDMPKLFQRFWQAATSGRYYASTGLGLYLCRKIVELHDGQIWCKSVLGKGSTFTFTIGNVGEAQSS